MTAAATRQTPGRSRSFLVQEGGGAVGVGAGVGGPAVLSSPSHLLSVRSVSFNKDNNNNNNNTTTGNAHSTPPSSAQPLSTRSPSFNRDNNNSATPQQLQPPKMFLSPFKQVQQQQTPTQLQTQETQHKPAQIQTQTQPQTQQTLHKQLQMQVHVQQGQTPETTQTEQIQTKTQQVHTPSQPQEVSQSPSPSDPAQTTTQPAPTEIQPAPTETQLAPTATQLGPTTTTQQALERPPRPLDFFRVVRVQARECTKRYEIIVYMYNMYTHIYKYLY